MRRQNGGEGVRNSASRGQAFGRPESSGHDDHLNSEAAVSGRAEITRDTDPAKYLQFPRPVSGRTEILLLMGSARRERDAASFFHVFFDQETP
jgi:hypothetical protein